MPVSFLSEADEPPACNSGCRSAAAQTSRRITEVGPVEPPQR